MKANRDTKASGAGRTASLLTLSLGALSGVLAAAVALGAGELLAGLIRPEASPVTAVGGAVVDRTPRALKDYAVRHFGTDDKLVLRLGILVLLVLFAAAVGAAAPRWRRSACAAVLLFGVIGTLAAWSRPDRHDLDVLPSALGALAGAAALWVLAGRLTHARAVEPAAVPVSAPDTAAPRAVLPAEAVSGPGGPPSPKGPSPGGRSIGAGS